MTVTVGDRVMLWLARRFPSQARAIRWRVYDRQMDRAADERAAARDALARDRRRGGGR